MKRQKGIERVTSLNGKGDYIYEEYGWSSIIMKNMDGHPPLLQYFLYFLKKKIDNLQLQTHN